MKGMIDVVAILHGVLALMQGMSLLILGLVILLYGGGGVALALAGAAGGDDDAVIGGIVTLFASGFIAIPALFILLAVMLQGATAFGIMKRRSWAPMAGYITSALCILSCSPLSMIVGILTIVMFMDKDAAGEFNPSF